MSIIDEMHSWASIVGVGVTGWVEGRKADGRGQMALKLVNPL